MVYRKLGHGLVLESAAFEGGRFIANGTTPQPNYFITDHLGSVRVVVNAEGAVLERNDYYPFGKRWDEGLISGYNRHRYNAKEEQGFLALPYTDYGARMADPTIGGRWITPDPLQEKYYSIGQYVFCAGNPIKYIDPDGRFIGTAIGSVIGGIKGAYNAHKEGRDMWAGAAEGAVAGAITGAAIDLAVAATVATGGGAVVVVGAGLLAGTAGGAGGAVAGDVVGQVVEQTSKGADIAGAVNNISTDNFAAKAKDGAVSGAISGLTGGMLGAFGQAAANSTKAVQGAMSKNITTTATTLTTQGASQATVNTAVNKITQGMSAAKVNSLSSMLKAEAGVSTATETSIIIVEQQRKDNK